jgi:Predicted inhibitor of MCP methylation, homolog of CheC
MDKSLYDDFSASFGNSFIYVFNAVLGLDLVKSEIVNEIGVKKFCAVIGMVGGNKGRVRLEAGYDTVKKIAENMTGETINNIMETYMCLSEFTNMVCGNAITAINNKYRGKEMRLTPPAIFSGDNIRIVTPSIYSTINSFDSEYGKLLLDIGFEGVC